MRKIRFATLFILFLVNGCASPREEAADLAHDAGWQWSIISTDTFDLATAAPSGRPGQILWIYIEGDGHAFLDPSTPSSDPTPSDPIALHLALANPGAAPVAYLARPCQYVLPDHGRNCGRRYWTNARYALEVIDSINQAIDVLKINTGASQLILAGYSGGGSVAVLAATRRNDVAAIITVAANLDIAYWAKRDGLTPLNGSLNPADFARNVSSIPQFHFTGGRDDTVGNDVVRAFMNQVPSNAPARSLEIPSFDHKCCWAEQWANLLNRPDVKSLLMLP